jgi:hypothetical protein
MARAVGLPSGIQVYTYSRSSTAFARNKDFELNAAGCLHRRRSKSSPQSVGLLSATSVWYIAERFDDVAIAWVL